MGNGDLQVNIYRCPRCLQTVAEYWQDGRYFKQSIHDDPPEDVARRAREIGHSAAVVNYEQAYQPQRNNPAD